jgi:hypothetical protein
MGTPVLRAEFIIRHERDLLDGEFFFLQTFKETKPFNI